MNANDNNGKPSTQDVDKLASRYVIGRERSDGSSHFLRIKIPNGRLTTLQFEAIADLAKTYGRGYAEITDRQNLQLHWIEPENALEIFSKLGKIGFSTDHGGQGIPTAHGGDVRAIASCPVADVDKFELIDTLPIVKEIDNFFDGNRDYLDLPRKFKISVSSCSLNCINPMIHDLSFVAVSQPSGKVGFAVLVGGTVATSPQLARSLNVLVKPEEVLEVTKSTVEIFRDFGSRESKAKARFRWLVDAWGIEKLRKAIEEKMGKALQSYQLHHLPTCKGEHIGVHSQKQEGYSYITLPVMAGILSSEKMLKIAQVADDFGNRTLCLTPFQNITIINIPNESVNNALSTLEKIGNPAVDAELKWTTLACAGNFCGKTIDHPKKRAIETMNYLEERFGKEALAGLKLRINFSGCPNSCAKHLTADIGLRGVPLASEGKPMPAYNVYVGGNAESNVVLGKLIQAQIPGDQIKNTIANLIDAYLKNRTKVSFDEFCSSKTTEELQAILNSNLKKS